MNVDALLGQHLRGREAGPSRNGERQREQQGRESVHAHTFSLRPGRGSAHQVLQEVDVVDREQDAGQHLVGDGEVAQVGA
jgi:hypothetical protein